MVETSKGKGSDQTEVESSDVISPLFNIKRGKEKGVVREEGVSHTTGTEEVLPFPLQNELVLSRLDCTYGEPILSINFDRENPLSKHFRKPLMSGDHTRYRGDDQGTLRGANGKYRL